MIGIPQEGRIAVNNSQANYLLGFYAEFLPQLPFGGLFSALPLLNRAACGLYTLLAKGIAKLSG